MITNAVILLYFDTFLHRKRELPPTSGAGLSWRQTCCSTRSVQLTDTCWVSSCWRGVQSDALSLMDSLPFLWCLKGRDWKPTDSQQEMVRLRRAGWKLCSQPATVTSPCWSETWGGSMKVSYECVLFTGAKHISIDLYILNLYHIFFIFFNYITFI